MDGPTDVDALADALRVDGVVVDRVMGSGEAQEAHDRIAQLVRETPFPVYVALVETPPGLPDDGLDASDALAGLLNRRLGDGMYVLHTSDSILTVQSFGLDADPALLSLTARSNVDVLDAAMAEAGDFRIGTEDYMPTPAVSEAEAVVLEAEAEVAAARAEAEDGYPPTIADADAERIAETALELQVRADWRPEVVGFVEVRAASSGLSALVGGLAGLVIALLLGQTLRGWPRYGKPLPVDRRKEQPVAAPPPDLDTERARATELLDALATRLEATDWDVVRDREVAGRALTARDAAEPLLASDDVADAIGAQVVARAGARDLARGRRGSGGPMLTCFFDPRHPQAKATVAWRLGDGEVDVPCCTRCARTVRDGGVPEHLRLRTRRGTVAYWERDDVWARTGFGAVTDDLARDVLAARAGER